MHVASNTAGFGIVAGIVLAETWFVVIEIEGWDTEVIRTASCVGFQFGEKAADYICFAWGQICSPCTGLTDKLVTAGSTAPFRDRPDAKAT